MGNQNVVFRLRLGPEGEGRKTPLWLLLSLKNFVGRASSLARVGAQQEVEEVGFVNGHLLSALELGYQVGVL